MLAGTAHSLASSPHVLQRLQGITASTSAVVRLRGLNFVAYLAGQSQEAMHQLQAQGDSCKQVMLGKDHSYGQVQAASRPTAELRSLLQGCWIPF